MKHILFSLAVLTFFSPAIGQWIQKESAPATLRHHPVTFVIDDKAYYVTGYDDATGPLNDFYEYDASTDTWAKLSDFPGSVRGFACGASIDGKGYIGFGVNAVSFLNDLWEYNPVTDQWKILSPLPGPARKHPAFVAFDGKIFVGLGDGSSGNFRDWYVYTISSNTWKKSPDLPAIARHHPYYFHAGDFVYTGMGHSVLGIENDWWKYDTDNDTWEQMNDFPGEARVAGTQFSYNDKGYILGGDGSDHLNLDEGEFYEYDHTNDSWKELPPAPGQSRWAPGSFVVGDMAFMTSGETGNGILYNDLWAYDLTQFLSVSDIAESASSFEVYPNPASNKIVLHGQIDPREIVEVSIADATGKQVAGITLNDNEIDISALPAQMYFLNLKTKTGENLNSRFVKVD